MNMDLSKFFDRVQHDVLLARVSRKVHDKRLLKLIGRFLRAGVMVDGHAQPSHEGTMQGGPLSPLLGNVMLDDFDKVLESRGLHFVRYADDFLVFTKTAIAARRVFGSVGRYLDTETQLVVNRQKSCTCSTDGVEFLGYQFHGYGGQIRVSPKNIKRFKQRSRELLNRNRGMSTRKRLYELTMYLRGWIGYFALDQRRSQFNKSRQVASPPPASLHLEAMALTTHPRPEAQATRHSTRGSLQPRQQSQGPLGVSPGPLRSPWPCPGNG